jgi:hypothetical protein
VSVQACIMTLMPTLRAAPLRWLALACAGLLAGVLLWHVATGGDHAEVVSESSARDPWKTIEYHGVRVDIPASWDLTDMDDCEFDFEHWAPPNSPKCGRGGGVAFYRSATFDPAQGPGVRRTHSSNSPTWGGYVDVGDFAVYVSDAHRDLVQKVLNSAR